MTAELFRVRAARIGHDPAPHRLPPALAARVAENWARRAAENPSLYDGDILLFRDVSVAGGVLTATAVTAKYALLVALVDLDPPDLGLVNLFGAAAPVSSDGALILGRMGAHTFEPGAVKFAAGTPDLSDLDAPRGRVDLDGSIVRELAEETGLDAAAAMPDRDYVVARQGVYLALVRPYRFPEPAEALGARCAAHIAADPDPELSGVEVVRRADDPVLADASVLVKPIAAAVLAGAAGGARA